MAATFAFGDALLVRFPFTSQAASKQRPAVVVSSDRYAIERPDVVLLAVSSQRQPAPVEIGVRWGKVVIANWQAAGLIKPSVIMPIVATFEQRVVIKRLGVLTPVDANALVSAFARILGPAPQPPQPA